MPTAEAEKPKFTPGPWDIMQGRSLLHVETRHDNPAGGGQPICSLPLSHAGDATLIMAAPELLAALKRATAELEALASEPCIAEFVAEARALIARVEG